MTPRKRLRGRLYEDQFSTFVFRLGPTAQTFRALSRGEGTRDEAIRTFAFCVVSGFEKVVFAMDKGNTGGVGGIQPIFGYRLACVTGGFLVRFLQTADCCF